MEKKLFDFSNLGFISSAYFDDNSYLLKEDAKRDFIREIERHNKNIYRQKLKDLKNSQVVFPNKAYYQEMSSLNEEAFCEESYEENDISFYEQLLESCPSILELPHYLPKKGNSSFLFLMNQLAAKILKEIVEIQDFIAEENLSSEEKEEFIEEMREKKEFLNSLISYRDKTEFTEMDQEEMKKENTLLFLQSSSSNYYVFQDEKKLEQEYYASFLGLLESIQKGTFKNLKVFRSNNKLQGLLEVKDFKTRIVFQRLERDVFVILSIFLKKVDIDSYYREQLETRVARYQNAYKTIKKNLENEVYLRENAQITLDLKVKWGGG